MSAPVLRVSELNLRARRLLEEGFPLLWVGGEISNLVRASSGHVYFTLRDETSQVRCAMFRNRAQLLGWQLANGQSVEVQARVTLYEARGDFQLGVESMRRGGQGRLYEAFMRLRERLAAEGIFDAGRKRALPAHPRTIGIVTSPQAAALRDVVVTLRRRAPHLRMILYASTVQGDGAAQSLAGALATADARAEVDLLLLVRGGGSMEDLWAFNEEVLARAIASCRLPVVAGVGHETDTTIADFVADVRAATPTAAAELATAGWLQAAERLRMAAAHLHRAVHRRLETAQQRVDRMALRLVHPRQRIERSRERVDALARRLHAAIRADLRQREHDVIRLQGRLLRRPPDTVGPRARLAALAHRLPQAVRAVHTAAQRRLATQASALAHLEPSRTLARGYAIVRDAEGRVVTDATVLHAGDALNLRLARGRADVLVASAHDDGVPKT